MHRSRYSAIFLCSLWSNMFIFTFGGQVIQKMSISPSVHTPDLARKGKMDRTLINHAPFFIHWFCLIKKSLSTVMFPTGQLCHVYLDSEHATMTPAQTITHTVLCGPVSLRFLAMKTGLIITGGGFCKDLRSRSCSPIESPSPLRLHEST